MLIDEEQDTRELLRVEDQAILTAENPTPEEPVEDVAALIERLTNGEDLQPG